MNQLLTGSYIEFLFENYLNQGELSSLNGSDDSSLSDNTVLHEEIKGV